MTRPGRVIHGNHNMLLLAIVTATMLAACSFLSGDKEVKHPKSISDVLKLAREGHLPTRISLVINPQQGGSAGVRDSSGNIVHIVVPPFAVEDSLYMTIELLTDSIPTPFSDTGPIAFKIDADNYLFQRPLSIITAYSDSLTTDETPRLFHVIDSSTVRFPLWQKVDSLTSSAQTYVDGIYCSAKPTAAEFEDYFINPEDEILTEDISPLEIELGQLASAAEAAQWRGFDEHALEQIDQAETLLGDEVDEFLSEPVPSDPCGDYEKKLTYYGKVVLKMNMIGETAHRISDRMALVYPQCRPTSGRITYHVDMTPPLMDTRWEDDLELPGSEKPNLPDKRPQIVNGPGINFSEYRSWHEGEFWHSYVSEANSRSDSMSQVLRVDIELIEDHGFFRWWGDGPGGRILMYEDVWGPDENAPAEIKGLGLFNDRVQINLPFEHGGQVVYRDFTEGVLVVQTYTLYLDK